jgi:hypothetical protein
MEHRPIDAFCATVGLGQRPKNAPPPAVQEGTPTMEAPKVRLRKVLDDVSEKLDRMLPKDRLNLRAAFDQLVAETSDRDGANDGLALMAQERWKVLLGACPQEGPSREALAMLQDRLLEEREYRGKEWARTALALTLREHIKVFGEEKPAAVEHSKKAAGGEK